MAVIPAKQARLRRARASRDLVNTALANGVKRSDELVSTGEADVYWIPALATRAKPGSLRPE